MMTTESLIKNVLLNADFEDFPKIARFNRDCVITEKIDGTNAQIYIADDGVTMLAGSRTRWVTPQDDNHGFARWVDANRDELLKLGPGRHFGEWWGSGIQRGYGLTNGTKRFSLFNVGRWNEANVPACVGVVPTLWSGNFKVASEAIAIILEALRIGGSAAAPGFMKPEGIVIFHEAARQLFKITLEKDDVPKTLVTAK